MIFFGFFSTAEIKSGAKYQNRRQHERYKQIAGEEDIGLSKIKRWSSLMQKTGTLEELEHQRQSCVDNQLFTN